MTSLCKYLRRKVIKKSLSNSKKTKKRNCKKWINLDLGTCEKELKRQFSLLSFLKKDLLFFGLSLSRFHIASVNTKKIKLVWYYILCPKRLYLCEILLWQKEIKILTHLSFFCSVILMFALIIDAHAGNEILTCFVVIRASLCIL